MAMTGLPVKSSLRNPSCFMRERWLKPRWVGGPNQRKLRSWSGESFLSMQSYDTCLTVRSGALPYRQRLSQPCNHLIFVIRQAERLPAPQAVVPAFDRVEVATHTGVTQLAAKFLRLIERHQGVGGPVNQQEWRRTLVGPSDRRKGAECGRERTFLLRVPRRTARGV